MEKAPQQGEEGYGLYCWFQESMGSTVAGEAATSLSGVDTTCPTCGDHDCMGGLPCDNGDGV